MTRGTFLVLNLLFRNATWNSSRAQAPQHFTSMQQAPKKQKTGATAATTAAEKVPDDFATNAATATAKMACFTNANIAAAAHCSNAKATATSAVAALTAAQNGTAGASAASAATAVASATAAARTADTAVTSAGHAQAAAEAAVGAAEAQNCKDKAVWEMISQLMFDRDRKEDVYGNDFGQESIGALSWADRGSGETGCCAISNIGLVTAENSLRDTANGVREYTVAVHGDLHTFPGELEKLAQRLRRAADAADAAGFDGLPGGLVGYTPTHDALVAGPGDLAELSRGAAQLVRDLHLRRSMDEDDEDVGNVSWRTERGDARHCPIAGVLDMHRAGVLFDPLAATHTALADKYGSFQAFPQRLRELSGRMQRAAASAANLGFMDIPEEEADEAGGGEDGDDDDDGSGSWGGEEGGDNEEGAAAM